jgi:Fe2+ transport system protein FeoA
MDKARTHCCKDEVPLSGVAENTPVRLSSTSCGRGLEGHLAAMGLRRGARLVVIHRSRPGPFIVGFGHTRVAIGRGIADRLMVVPLCDNKAN